MANTSSGRSTRSVGELSSVFVEDAAISAFQWSSNLNRLFPERAHATQISTTQQDLLFPRDLISCSLPYHEPESDERCGLLLSCISHFRMNGQRENERITDLPEWASGWRWAVSKGLISRDIPTILWTTLRTEQNQVTPLFLFAHATQHGNGHVKE